MEIKDVNNNGMLALSQLSRLGVQGGNGVLSEFGDLLSEIGKEKNIENMDKTSPVKTEKKEASVQVSQPREYKNTVGEKINKADEKVSKPTEKSVKTSEKPKQENKSVDTENRSAQENVKQQKDTVRADNGMVVEEKAVVAEIENGENLAVSEEDISEISLDALTLMGVVAVVNPINNEVVQLSGEELSKALSDLNVETVSVIENADSNEVALVDVPEEVFESEQFEEVLRKVQTVDFANENVVAENAQNNDVDVLEVQAEKLGEAFGEGRRAKVSVNIKEEKFADAVDSGLVKKSTISDNVIAQIASVEDVKTVENDAILSADNASAVDAKSQEMPLTMIGGVVNAGFSVVNDDAMPVLNSSEGNATAISQAGAVSGETFVSAKGNIANDDVQSFRDVYKGMGKEVVEQVKVNITKSAVKGVDTIEIQLKPEDLGKIEIKMQIGKDGKLQAHIISSRAETADILQKEMSNLQKAFNDAGFQADDGSLSFSFRDESQAGQERDRNNLRHFIGNVLEQENVLDAANGEMYTGASWNGKNGLNIRV